MGKSVWSKDVSLNSFMQKKWYPLTFTDAYWMFMETKQRTGAQWGGGWCTSAVVTVTLKDKPCSRWSYTAVTSRDEESLDQLIHRIRDLCTELNTGLDVLEMVMATFEYHWVCARWVPWMFKHEQRGTERTPYASLLEPVEQIQGWRWQLPELHHYWCRDVVSPLWAGVKMAVHGVVTCEFPIEEKEVQDTALRVMCTVFWDSKEVILLELGQTINSDSYVVMLCWRLELSESDTRRRQLFCCNTITLEPTPIIKL